jgi:MFS family permease
LDEYEEDDIWRVFMDATFWVGLVLGGIVGIILELLTRPLQRFLDRRLETRARVRGDELRQQKVGNREAVRDFLVLQVLETTLIGALTGIASGVLFGASDLVNANIQDQWWQKGLIAAGQIVAILGGLLVLRIAGDAISIARAASGRKSRKEQLAE